MIFKIIEDTVMTFSPDFANKLPNETRSNSKESRPGTETWKITVSNENDYIQPLGIAEWGDFSKYEKVKSSENVKEVKMIGKHLVFIRFNAAAGDTEMRMEFKVTE